MASFTRLPVRDGIAEEMNKWENSVKSTALGLARKSTVWLLYLGP